MRFPGGIDATRMVGIDVNNVPYYGPPTPDVVGGPKKQGTK